MEEKSRQIFGNRMPDGVYRKACKSKKKFVKKFGDDSSADYPVQLSENAHIGQELGVVDVLLGDAAAPGAPKEKAGFDKEKGIIVGNIRMGFGHYRISMAIASAEISTEVTCRAPAAAAFSPNEPVWVKQSSTRLPRAIRRMARRLYFWSRKNPVFCPFTTSTK